MRYVLVLGGVLLVLCGATAVAGDGPGPVAADADGSGSVDSRDVQLTINAALGIDVRPWHTDADYSGATDAGDVQLTINAVLAIVIDTDSDGLADVAEVRLGTDPLDPDTDKDGVSDGQEMLDGTDPLTPDEGETVPELVAVAAGDFPMGPVAGEFSDPDELPRHDVTLSAYSIGRFEVTNLQYARMLNRALRSGVLTGEGGGRYAGGDVYAGGHLLLALAGQGCLLAYTGEAFAPITRDGYPMADHPVVQVTWYGAALYCNWLSGREGLSLCYDPVTFTRATPVPDGYRLPTEAEWERAAAWDGSHHWRYAYLSDTFALGTRLNTGQYTQGLPYEFANPLGLSDWPYTSPAGYYDGVNPGTVDSPGPVGAYDMSGNAAEWCHDWYDDYPSAAVTDPAGPATGSDRVARGGSWYASSLECRTANRSASPPGDHANTLGFRIARTPGGR